MQLNQDTGSVSLPEIICIVCGSPLYQTDHTNFEVTFHCTSPEARFWDYDRGTADQVKSKEHWERSRREIILGQG